MVLLVKLFKQRNKQQKERLKERNIKGALDEYFDLECCMEKPASKKTDRTKNSKMVQTVSWSIRTLKKKKQPAQRKILRMGRILSVPFWAHNARYLMTFANSS